MIPRRQFLLRTSAGAAGMAGVATGSYASVVEPSSMAVRRYELPISDLPGGLDGFRILHVSDTHYGPFNSRAFIERTAELGNSLNPDFVALTGDYVHFTPDSVEDGIAVLSRFKGRFGSAAVMGNHEHWEGADRCREALRNAGIPLVENRGLFLDQEGVSEHPRTDSELCIAGTGDYWEGTIDLDAAFENAAPMMPRILLSHNPDAAEELKGHRVDVMLSGHTHGGQIVGAGAFASGSHYGLKYLGGLCQGPDCPVVVSRGVGMAFIPVRMGVPPELVLLTLRRADSSGRKV